MAKRLYVANSTNILANSKYYGTILQEYNKQFKENDGKVELKKFWKDVIVPLIPEYGLMSWYQFARRFKDEVGLRAIQAIGKTPVLPIQDIAEQQAIFKENLLSNEIATRQGINKAINVGLQGLDVLINNPESLSPEKRAELLFKAMRAQDSRIFALGKIKEDSREDMKLKRAFDSATYEANSNDNYTDGEISES